MIKLLFKEEFSWFEVIAILSVSSLVQISLWWFLLIIPIVVLQGIGTVVMKEMEDGE